MVRYKWLKLFAWVLLAAACQKKMPELSGFDKQSWISDKNGCDNKRSTMVDSIQLQKDKLLSLNEMEVVSLLGKPDQNELSRRHQKRYAYFIFPSRQCGLATSNNELKLIIRFNAMGLAKEISIE